MRRTPRRSPGAPRTTPLDTRRVNVYLDEATIRVLCEVGGNMSAGIRRLARWWTSERNP